MKTTTVPTQKKIVLGAGLLAMTATAIAFGMYQNQPASMSLQVRDESGDIRKAAGIGLEETATEPSADVHVRVNGQPVPLDSSGAATVETDAGKASVKVSDTGTTTSLTSQTTQSNSPNSSVNVSVSSTNVGGNGSSTTLHQSSQSTSGHSGTNFSSFSNTNGQVNVYSSR